MTDYSELVRKMRTCIGDKKCFEKECRYWSELGCMDGNICCDAAAAIEALQAEQKKTVTQIFGEEQMAWEGRCKDLMKHISDLQAEVDTLKRTDAKRCQECLYLGQPVEQQLPKRGHWIIDGAFTYNLRELNGKAYEPVYRCSCCNRQMESYLRLDEPKMPEDADFPEFCPHCGAKMEVQDG